MLRSSLLYYYKRSLCTFCFQNSGKKSVSGRFMRQKQCAIFALLHARQLQGGDSHVETRVIFKESFHLFLVFVTIDCTGRIHQSAVFGK